MRGTTRQGVFVNEIRPGLFHWTTFHEGIQQDVDSYFVESSAALIDPMLPSEGLEWFAGHREPSRVLLTDHHHYRDSDRFSQEFGCTVTSHETALDRFGPGQRVEGFRFGNVVAPGIVALEVGALFPDETAFHIAVGDGALALGDALVRSADGSLVALEYLMDDPEAVTRALRESFRRLLDEDFDSLLLAHGGALIGDGKAALRAFAESSDS
ncbi:MAG: hypothetical protein KY463_02880 [Actinobacteria bacterium]|nr:hypothetical protein [Actinomycetota bacterium]